MNRQQRRALAKSLRHSGVKNADTLVKKYDESRTVLQNETKEMTPAQDIVEGQKIKLRIDAIQARVNYNNLSEQYRQFVEQNADTVFTAHIDQTNMISMQENPRWLFWSGDLIKIEEPDNAGRGDKTSAPTAARI